MRRLDATSGQFGSTPRHRNFLAGLFLIRRVESGDMCGQNLDVRLAILGSTEVMRKRTMLRTCTNITVRETSDRVYCCTIQFCGMLSEDASGQPHIYGALLPCTPAGGRGWSQSHHRSRLHVRPEEIYCDSSPTVIMIQ